MAETSQQPLAPVCPGCHFGCSLDAYRCGRGKGFFGKWRTGEPIPERGVPPMMRGGEAHAVRGDSGKVDGKSGRATDNRGPGASDGRGKGGRPALPAGERVMHALNIAANVLQNRHTEAAERKVLATLSRQGGFFAVSLLGKRTLVDGPQLDEAMARLVEEGLAEHADDPIAGDVLHITDDGRARQSEWDAERALATADFLAPLTEAEQDQLAQLLFRLVAIRR